MSKTIHLLIASTREGRVGPAIADWVQQQIKDKFDAEVKIIDLYDEKLPFFNNSVSPMRMPDNTPHGQAWAKKIKDVERMIIITPEYNRSMPASLKNALDYLWEEWHNLPTAIISYGHIDGGARAAMHLKDTLGWLKVNRIENELNIPLTVEMLNEKGQLKDHHQAFKTHAKELEVLVSELLDASKEAKN